MGCSLARPASGLRGLLIFARRSTAHIRFGLRTSREVRLTLSTPRRTRLCAESGVSADPTEQNSLPTEILHMFRIELSTTSPSSTQEREQLSRKYPCSPAPTPL